MSYQLFEDFDHNKGYLGTLYSYVIYLLKYRLFLTRIYLIDEILSTIG